MVSVSDINLTKLKHESARNFPLIQHTIETKRWVVINLNERKKGDRKKEKAQAHVESNSLFIFLFYLRNNCNKKNQIKNSIIRNDSNISSVYEEIK